MRRALLGLVAAATLGSCGGDTNTQRAPDGTVLLVNGPLAATTLEDTPIVFYSPRAPTITHEPSHGTATVDGTEITYDPAQDYDGDDTLTVAFSNGSTNSVAAITVTMTPVNDPPVAHDAIYDLGAMILDVAADKGLLTHGTDIDSTVLTAQVATEPEHGTLTLNADGSFTYTIADTLKDSFTYTVTDDDGAVSEPATVSFRFIPVAVDDMYAATEGVPLHVNATDGVLANDSSVGGEDLGASTVTGTTHGSLSLASDGSFTYSVGSTTATSDSFTYMCTQRDGAFAIATVTITISP